MRSPEGLLKVSSTTKYIVRNASVKETLLFTKADIREVTL